MDSSRDNPFIRFATFWWALGTFLIFGVIIAVIWAFNTGNQATLEDVAAKQRYKTKHEIFTAQAAAIPKEAMAKAMETEGAKLAASKPTANTEAAQLVPNSPTAKKLAEGASTVDIDGVNKAAEASASEPVDAAVMEAGKATFLMCSACHGQNGEGGPIAPPLAGSDWVIGPVSNLIMIQMRGLAGPIHVSGKDYNLPAPMAPMGAALPDESVAAVLTFIRNSWGNKASAVKPEWVKGFRSEVGKPALAASDLIKPAAK